jgi:hypothetical protein
MTETDPLVPLLAGLVVDMIGWLDDCDDDEVNPDSAVKMMENATWVLVNLPHEQRGRLLLAIEDMASAEDDPWRRQRLVEFPFACGLVEDPPA